MIQRSHKVGGSAVVRRSFLILIFIFLSVITVIQALGSDWRWYSPFLMVLGIIVLAALIQQNPGPDEL
jgi:hypothetical protein